MGAANSTLSSTTSKPQFPQDGITVVSERRVDGVDPIGERLQSLRITSPLLKSPPPTESSFSDILVNRLASSSSGALDPRILSELFSVYHDWMERKTKEICQKQEELENKMEIADALAIKVLQRYNFSLSTMKTTAYNLSEVKPLQIEVGELKGKLTEVLSNCDALCKRISARPQTSASETSSANDMKQEHNDSEKSATSLA